MCSVTPPVDATLPMDERAPAIARSLLASGICAPHHGHVLDEAQLLMSELVTNAVLHGAPPITVQVECQESAGMCVRVTDGSAMIPSVREMSPDSLGGRGMALVDLLSDEWGVEPAAPGKQVWFRLEA